MPGAIPRMGCCPVEYFWSTDYSIQYLPGTLREKMFATRANKRHRFPGETRPDEHDPN